MVSAYSVGKSKRKPLYNQELSNFPGPNQYSPQKTLKHHPSWKIGSSQRTLFQENITPAPGQYRDYSIDQQKKRSPAYTISGKYQKDEVFEFRKNIPGPSQYHPKTFTNIGDNKNGAFLIGKTGGELAENIKKIIQDRNKTPGVGKYRIERSSLKKTNAAIIGNAKKDAGDQKPIIPGPGHYIKNPEPFRHSFHAIIGDAPRQFFTSKEDEQKIRVGPGSYENKSFFEINPGASAYIIPRRNDVLQKNQGGPGPSSYSINTFISKRQPVVAFYKASRSNSVQEITPGPSSYTPGIFKQRSPKAIIGDQKRFELTQSNEKMLPGPGSYSNLGITLKRAPSTHLIPRRNDPMDRLRNSENPGVGKYNPEKAYRRSQSFYIPKEKRACTELNDGRAQPGPGSYQLNLQSKTIGVTIPKYGRDEKNRPATPGPGSYNIKPMFNDVPKYLLNFELID